MSRHDNFLLPYLIVRAGTTLFGAGTIAEIVYTFFPNGVVPAISTVPNAGEIEGSGINEEINDNCSDWIDVNYYGIFTISECESWHIYKL